jgi:hypothetical protein
MRSLSIRLAEGAVLLALMSSGFALGTQLFDFSADVEAPQAGQGRGCDHRDDGESVRIVGQGDARAALSFLGMCQS